MKLIAVENVKPPVYLAKPVYDTFGKTLLPAGAKLTVHYLKRLLELNIKSIYVEDGNDVSIEIDNLVSEEIRMRVVQTTKEELLNVKAGNALGHKKIQQVVSEIINDVLRNKDLILHLTDIRAVKDHTFSHSANVCILSLMTGLKMGYDDLKLKELGTGALLHDVGKAILPDQMVNSNKIFTAEEYRFMQKHCEYGYEILRNSEHISLEVAQVAWQHHERYNGQGYPNRLAGEEIHEFARIVAVADVYDALSGDRPYRQRAMPYEVVEVIRAAQGTDFDPDVVEAFISNIAVFPVGSKVILNSGFKGMVVSVTKDFPTRPKVQLLYDNKGQRIEGMQFVDLMKELTYFVTDIEFD